MNIRTVRFHVGFRRVAWVLAAGGVSLGVPATTVAQQTVSDVRIRGAEEQLLDRPVTIRLSDVSLARALQEISGSAKIRVGYRIEVVNAIARRVSIDVVNRPLGAVFQTVLSGTGLRAVVAGDDALALEPVIVAAQAQGTITGVVTSAKSNAPLANATVFLDAATQGITVDANGAFRVTASAGEHRVTVRAVGFTPLVKTVTVTNEQTTTLTIALESSVSVLDQVVVTGTVVATERKAIPTPITVISAADIEKRGITRIDQLFRGEVPGVVSLDFGIQRYNQNTLGAMAASQVYTRGTASLAGSANPLKTYVDGVEMLDPQYLGTIDPKSIERIEIITGPQAATIYGSGAMGGVMQIFTKKGNGQAAPDVTVSLKYGMLESSLATGKAPAHNHFVSAAGGNGSVFSYSVNGSYGYTGQWQPLLYARNYGLQGGVNYRQGKMTASGSVSATAGANGTTYNMNAPYVAKRRLNGEWAITSFFNPYLTRQTRSTSVSQITGLNLDYALSPIWQHHLNVGVNQMNFDLVPEAPVYVDPSDTLYTNRASNGRRTSMSYNTTLMPSLGRMVSTTLTFGMTGSFGHNAVYSGSTSNTTSTSWTAATVTSRIGDENYGGFGTARIGLMDRLFLTASVRGERNPTYGADHAIDWTPTMGMAYTMEYGALTMKTLFSYGRSTRPPNPSYRLSVVTNYSNIEPAQILTQVGNPELTPEYERGPQGGLEVYYGNLGSFTINHYQQTVTDLILPIPVGSVPYHGIGETTIYYLSQTQYQNVAKMRQKGWEGTGSLTFGPLSLKGTYSWNDSRIIALSPSYTSTGFTECGLDGQCVGAQIVIGAPFKGIPSHTASTTTSYALGGTTISLVTNWIGATTRSGGDSPVIYDQVNERLRMYSSYYRQVSRDFTQPGYVKADLSASQRLAGWITATLNVTNLANSFYGEGSHIYPTLGRRTDLGLSMRFPRMR